MDKWRKAIEEELSRIPIPVCDGIVPFRTRAAYEKAEARRAQLYKQLHELDENPNPPKEEHNAK